MADSESSVRQISLAILVRDGRILLGRRSSARKTHPNMWDVIGGHVEPSETLEETLIREVHEEIGVTPISFMKLGASSEPNPEVNGTAMYHIFAVNSWDGGEPVALGDEHSQIRWFTIEEACQEIGLALQEYKAFFRTLTSEPTHTSS